MHPDPDMVINCDACGGQTYVFGATKHHSALMEGTHIYLAQRTENGVTTSLVRCTGCGSEIPNIDLVELRKHIVL